MKTIHRKMTAHAPSREEMVAATLADTIVEIDVEVVYDRETEEVYRIGPRPQVYEIGGDEYKVLVVDATMDRATLMVACFEKHQEWTADIDVSGFKAMGVQEFCFAVKGGVVVARVTVHCKKAS